MDAYIKNTIPQLEGKIKEMEERMQSHMSSNNIDSKEYIKLCIPKIEEMIKNMEYDFKIKDFDEFENKYECRCGKKYKHRQSLYNHKKTCILYNTCLTKNIVNIADNKEDEKIAKKIVELLARSIKLNKTNDDMQK
mgnify:CR=1 FL=1